MTILGIDPSSVKLAIVSDRLLSVKYTLAKQSGPEGCLEALRAMENLLVALPGRPGLAFIERPVVGRGGVQSSIKQAMVSGVLQAALLEFGWSVYLVHPSTWKTAIVGKPTAAKDEVARSLEDQWPEAHSLANGDQDLVDAAAICLYGVAIHARTV